MMVDLITEKLHRAHIVGSLCAMIWQKNSSSSGLSSSIQ
jgi:hypothetical protein